MLPGEEVSEPPRLFGDEAVYSEKMTEEEIATLQSDMPELEGFTIYSGVEILMTEDQSLVFRVLDAEFYAFRFGDAYPFSLSCTNVDAFVFGDKGEYLQYQVGDKPSNERILA